MSGLLSVRCPLFSPRCEEGRFNGPQKSGRLAEALIISQVAGQKAVVADESSSSPILPPFYIGHLTVDLWEGNIHICREIGRPVHLKR